MQQLLRHCAVSNVGRKTPFSRRFRAAPPARPPSLRRCAAAALLRRAASRCGLVRAVRPLNAHRPRWMWTARTGMWIARPKRCSGASTTASKRPSAPARGSPTASTLSKSEATSAAHRPTRWPFASSSRALATSGRYRRTSTNGGGGGWTSTSGSGARCLNVFAGSRRIVRGDR